MDTSIAAVIEGWFLQHDGNGEFALHDRSTPYAVIAPATDAPRVLYTTKPSSVVAGMSAHNVPDRLALVGGYGLPTRADLQWLREFVRLGRLYFLGDSDPVDLMVYCWMRALLYPMEMIYLGSGDRLLLELEAVSDTIPRIPLTPVEKESLVVLREVFSDIARWVGRKCEQELDDGLKMEVEALMPARTQ